MQHHPKTRKEGCDGGLGPYADLERDVLGQLSVMVKDEKAITTAVHAALAAQVPEREELQAELDDLAKTQRKDEAAREAAIDRLLTKGLDPTTVATLDKKAAGLAARLAERQQRMDDARERLAQAEVSAGHDAAIAAVLALFKRRYPLLQSTPAQKRAAMKALFSGASLRNKPSSAKEPTPDFGVFIRWQTDAKTGDRYLQWAARGRFFNVESDLSPDSLDRGYAAKADRTQGSDMSDLYRVYACNVASRRWSA